MHAVLTNKVIRTVMIEEDRGVQASLGCRCCNKQRIFFVLLGPMLTSFLIVESLVAFERGLGAGCFIANVFPVSKRKTRRQLSSNVFRNNEKKVLRFSFHLSGF